MIDLGRKRDMQILMMAVNDETETLSRRRLAYRTCMTIKHKMNDKHITTLRLRLIAASQNQDKPEVEKISARLNDYERRHHLNRKF